MWWLIILMQIFLSPFMWIKETYRTFKIDRAYKKDQQERAKQERGDE